MSGRPVKYCRDGVEVDYTTSTVRIRQGRPGESGKQALETALAQFKKLNEKDGTLTEVRERRYYKSPGRKVYERRRSNKHRRQIEREKLDRVPRRKRLQEQGK